uniref:Eukaryotic translation initiation factor 3 30 kDa subunit n=1 Tax=Amorphochlora amoebiformis TaxID=1561963 RepID=A0A7S0DSE3_9EUKA
MDDDEWDKAGEGEDEEVIDNWEGEDEDDNVDEAWDAEPEEKPEKKVEINNPKKLSAKQLAKKQEELERDGKRMLKKMTAKERHEEKLRQEAAIQKANENLIDDVFGENDFGGDEDDEAEEVDGFDRDAVKAKANEDLFGGSDDDEKEEIEEEKAEMKQFPCSTEEEVNEFAEFCAEKIKKAKATKLVIKYFKELIKKGTSELKLEDVRLIQKELTQVYNVKRVEKNQKAQKKKKPTIKMSKRGGGDLFDF